MFKDKNNKKLWTLVLVVLVLVAVSLVMQAKVLSQLADLQTFILRSTYVMDTNPLPAINPIMDTNPLPAKDLVMDTNPLPAKTY